MILTTWNLLADCHVRPGWYPRVAPADLDPAVRWPRVLAALAASNADLLCLQEVPPARLDAIRAALAPRQVVHAQHLGEGVAIASRVPLFGVETVEVGRKRALVARLANGLRVASVHLTWTGPEGVERPGVAQLAAVLRLAPDIVAGDFNAFPDWPERRLARDAGYSDIGPDAPTCNVNAWLQPLDTVLVRPPRSGRAEPVPRIEAHTPMPSASFASDHLAVTVRIQ